MGAHRSRRSGPRIPGVLLLRRESRGRNGDGVSDRAGHHNSSDSHDGPGVVSLAHLVRTETLDP
jgi:hypothetical protein